jgi:DNA-directed RNA polymerase specialized sigma54-like protein
MTTLQMTVAEQITKISPQVEEQVVDTLVKREKNRRADALVQCLDKMGRFEADLKKLKADQTSFDSEGKKVSETFSKARLEERAKLEKKIAKLSGAITKALEKADFADAYNLSQSDKGLNDDTSTSDQS